MKKITIGLLLCILCFISCISTSPVCITSSNTPLMNKKISQNLGKVEANSGISFNSSYILGLWMIGKPDIQSAIDKALLQKGADALINIKCYENFYWFAIWGFKTVTVEGEAIKFE